MPVKGRPYADRVTRPQTIGALLDVTVRVDSARPLLTYYDHAADERVELSAETLRNWVDKTANLLRDVLGADAGSRISVALPTHWQTVVWLLACWRLGAVVVPQVAEPDVAVIGPAAVASGTLPDAPEVVGTSLHPLGARFSTPVPLGMTDYGAEVFAQADTFTAGTAVVAAMPAWEETGVVDQRTLLELASVRAAELGVPPGGRLASDADLATLAGAVVVLVPLLVDGTVVLVRNPDPSALSPLVASERVDVVALAGFPAR